jgi:CRISPR-associated protein Cas5h
MTSIQKILSFDLSGDYAIFRRPYSTTSPLTYPVPTRTAIAGLLASILGRNRDSYYEEFSYENSRIGIQLLSPIKKMLLGLNLVDTKKGYYLWDIPENPRTQILYEVLKDIHWRIYVWLKYDTSYEDLKRRLESHTTVYTPYLGMAQMLADFKFVKEYNIVERKEGDQDSIATIVPEDYGVKPSPNHRMGRVNLPLYMDDNRTPSYRTMIYDSCTNFDSTTHRIAISNGEYFELDNEVNVILI